VTLRRPYLHSNVLCVASDSFTGLLSVCKMYFMSLRSRTAVLYGGDLPL
jgi:hypothetical protein